MRYALLCAKNKLGLRLLPTTITFVSHRHLERMGSSVWEQDLSVEARKAGR